MGWFANYGLQGSGWPYSIEWHGDTGVNLPYMSISKVHFDEGGA